MNIRFYTEEEQSLFRRVMTGNRSAIAELIDLKLDEESSIIAWLKRINLFSMYQQLKEKSSEKRNRQEDENAKENGAS